MTEEHAQVSINEIQHLHLELFRQVKYSEVVEIIPGIDEEMHFANIDDEHDRVLFVWWD